MSKRKLQKHGLPADWPAFDGIRSPAREVPIAEMAKETMAFALGSTACRDQSPDTNSGRKKNEGFPDSLWRIWLHSLVIDALTYLPKKQVELLKHIASEPGFAISTRKSHDGETISIGQPRSEIGPHNAVIVTVLQGLWWSINSPVRLNKIRNGIVLAVISRESD